MGCPNRGAEGSLCLEARRRQAQVRLSLVNILIRYEAQLEELKKKGYFMMSGGVKSTDVGVSTEKKRVKSTETTPRPVKQRTT